MTEKTTVVKDHKNIDQLLIHAHYVSTTFDAVFETSKAPEIKNHQDSVSMMLFDIALLYIKFDGDGRVLCVASIYDNASVLLVAELMCMLKDIFHNNIYVNEDTYIQDPTGKDLIWGRDNIDIHHEKVWGKKITHTIMFDDSMAGHG